MMDKDEAVLKLARGTLISMAHAEDLYDSFFEKPVVPQYVADWYEENKKDFDYNLWDYLTSWDRQTSTNFKEWINNENNATQTLVNMHQFGYEVEEEPKYSVEIKGASKDTRFLKRSEKGKWYFGNNGINLGMLPHTRKELEDADFGWVFNCPGVEVKEVE